MKKSAIILGSIALASLFTACSSSSPSQQVEAVQPVQTVQETSRTISVTGQGTATSSPDLVSFSFHVESEGEDREAVQSQNALETNAILALLKDAGVKDADIQTLDYNLSEKWDYEKEDFDGFLASQYINVKNQSAESAGDLISLIGAQDGVTGISGPVYEDSNQEEVYQEALLDAVENAKEKANMIAEANEVTIVQINSITENSSQSYVSNNYRMSGAMMAMAEDSVSIETGTQEISAEVYVVFEIA